MKFSILVPVYNVEKYLDRCVESLLEQTYADYEIILVNDGSTDNSGLICERYNAKYPELIKVIHKQNEGLISARRVAISHAEGEFCLFVDSDDFVETNLLEVVNENLEADRRIDMLLYSFTYYRDGKKAEKFRDIAEDGKVWEDEEKIFLYRKLVTSSDITSLCTKAIRTAILKNDSTDYTQYYGKNMAEDLLQSLYPVLTARKVKYIQKSLYNYRIVNDSTSHRTSMESILKMNTVHVYDKILEYLPEMGLDDKETRARIAAKWFNDTLYLVSKCYEDAKNHKECKRIVDYDWRCMLPVDVRAMSNEYENKSYQMLYHMLLSRKYFNIRVYFAKKKLYSIWKNRKIKKK